MRVLAIDTALGACAACILERGQSEPVASESLPLARGHAEALLPLIERVVARLDGGFAALGRVAVTVGPGSFTGLRVGVSAARAIALAAELPAVGVTTLSAYAAPIIALGDDMVAAVAIDARHGQIYFQAIGPGGRTIIAPRISAARDAARMLGGGPVRIAGSAAGLLAAEARNIGLDAAIVDASPAPDILWVARLGLVGALDRAAPKPLYLRPPDARPQDHSRLPRA